MKNYWSLIFTALLLSFSLNSVNEFNAVAQPQNSLPLAQGAVLAEAKQLIQQVKELYAQGKYAEAIPLAEKVVAICKQRLGPQDPQLAACLDGLGVLYFSQGRHEEAEPLLLKALDINKKTLEEKHPQVAQTFNNLAALYNAQGRYEEAEPLLLKALELHKKILGEKHPLVATSLNNLAALYNTQGRYDEAEPLLLKALELHKKILGEKHPLVATSINNLAALYEMQGKYEEAEPLLLKALGMREKILGEKHPDVAISINNLAALYNTQGRYEEAELFYLKALELQKEILGEKHPQVAKTINNLVFLRWAQKRTTSARELLQQGLDIEEENLSRNLNIGNQRQKKAFLAKYLGSTHAAIALHQQGDSQNLDAARLAFTTILRRKGRLLDVLGQSWQRLLDSADPQVIQKLNDLKNIQDQLSTLTTQGPGEQVQQYQERLQFLTNEEQKLTAQLSQDSAELAEVFQPTEINTIQYALPDNAALVEFVEYHPFDPKAPADKVWGPSRYAVYILLKSGQLQWADLGTVEEIKPLIQNFVAMVQSEYVGEKRLKAAAIPLYNKVFKPIRNMVGQTSHLMVAPDGDLNRFPFEALIDEQKQYLIQSFQFSYLSSGRDLLKLDNPAPKSTPALLLAGPDFDSKNLGPAKTNHKTLLSSTSNTRAGNERASDFDRLLPFPFLEGALQEGEAIKTFFGFKFFSKQGATESLVKQQSNPYLLHLATHGFFLKTLKEKVTPVDTSNATVADRSDQPLLEAEPLLRAGLAFAGVNDRKLDEQWDNGVLTAKEISGLDLRATQMVVMSACETGVGHIESGDGVYGLRRAFTLAGAKSQLMSLWNIQDDSTKQLMVAYYQRLDNGEARGQALREVQLEMINGTGAFKDIGKSYQAPYFWAPFIRAGDWRPLGKSVRSDP